MATRKTKNQTSQPKWQWLSYEMHPIRGMIVCVIEEQEYATDLKIATSDDMEPIEPPVIGVVERIGPPPIQLGTTDELPWEYEVGDRVILVSAGARTARTWTESDGIERAMVNDLFIGGIVRNEASE